MNDEKYEAPKQSKGDVAHSIVKAGLSSVPVIGSAAAELFQNVVQPPLEKRRIQWMDQVGKKLTELEENGLKLEELQENEQFISAAMHASQIALRNHQSEKLESLRNALVNIAKGQAPDEAVQHMFLDYVDSLTSLHIQILKLFQSPTPPPNVTMGALSHVLEFNMPDLKNRRELYDQIWRDLYSRGFVKTDSLHSMMSGNGLVQKRTSEFGDSFIDFITESG